MKKLPELTYSDWMEAMNVTDKVPQGWKRREEIEKEVGYKKDAVLSWMRNNPTRWEVQHFRVNRGGTRRLVPHYKLKQQSKNGGNEKAKHQTKS